MATSGELVGNWSGPPDNRDSSDDSVSLDDSGSGDLLDVQADHFADLSLDSLDDVAAAMDACRTSATKTNASSEQRKEIVRKLIKLRIRYQDLKERKENPLGGYESRGHRFINYADGHIPGVTNAKKVYCQQCSGPVWIYLQASQHCQECGYSVHASCMGDIRRDCVAIKVRAQPDFILEICPEKLLPEQAYCCVECDVMLSWDDPEREPRLCDYTGLHFCPGCHWNARSVTPARILFNWEFKEHPVSQATKQYLYLMWKRPVLNIRKIVPELFAFAPDLNAVQHARDRVMLAKKYLTVCRIASEERLLLKLAPRQHFVDDADHYSLMDLVDTKSGVLGTFLDEVVGTFLDHIRGCVLCSAKAFICELCDQKEAIFPFGDLCVSCGKCAGVFHKACFRPESVNCPKCDRKRNRTSSVNLD